MRDRCERRVGVAEVARRDDVMALTTAIDVDRDRRSGAHRDRRPEEQVHPNQPERTTKDASDRMHPGSQYSDSHWREMKGT